MQQIVDSLADYLRGNWPELLWIAVAAAVASYLAGRRSTARWRRRDFMNRVNVSLTSIDEGGLRIRTILEMDVEDLFLNRTAAARLTEFARQTTAEDPVIPIPAGDRWFYNNSVLNEISERFAAGHLRLDAGIPVQTQDYLMCLTCERAGEVRTQKIRAMLVRREVLENLPADEPAYESPNHVTRWETLQTMARQWRDRPDRFLSLQLSL